MSKINSEMVLRFFLAFIVFYFGINEIISPEKWVSFVPAFLGTGSMIINLVMIHGVILVLAGLALISRFHTRLVAGFLSLMLLDIVITLFLDGGLGATMVRDVGLLGMALALTFRN